MFHNAPKLFWWGVSMTCEVVVANRMGVALAADSAATFSGRDKDGTRKETYSSGACKIHQLSSVAHVGVMFFGASELSGLSWEVLVKAFSAFLGRTTMRTLEDYAAALGRFVEGNHLLYPPEHRLSLFRAMAVRSLRSILTDVQCQWAASSGARGATAIFASISETSRGRALPRGCSEIDVRTIVDTHREWLSSDGVKAAANTEELRLVSRELSVGKLCEAAVRDIFVNFRAVYGGRSSGVVLAGFGDDDAFPSVLELEFFGLVFDKLVVASRGGVKTQVDHRNRACIEAFAQTDAVEFFVGGVTNQIKETVGRAYRKHIRRFAEANIDGAAGMSDMDEVLGRSAADFGREWSEELLRCNLEPLQAVVEGMSLQQLAELAEALVTLESLKERATWRTQTVGGPVDVAIITRTEGLIWVKRKRYFDPILNHRLFYRQFEEQMT